MNNRCVLFLLVPALLVAVSGALAAVPWARVETGATDPLADPFWDDMDNAGNYQVTPNLSGTTPTGDDLFLRVNDPDDDTKIKIRNTTTLNGTGHTVRLVFRVNSGGKDSSYEVEALDTFGSMQTSFRRASTGVNGVLRLHDAGVEYPVPDITGWHVLWLVHAPGNQTYLWLDPSAADSTLSGADLKGPGGTGTGNRIGWGSEERGAIINYELDDIRWAVGVHLPSADDTLPSVDTPTPTRTPTSTFTNTPTPTAPTPTPTNTVFGEPVIELEMLRQIGYWENQNEVGGLRVIYVHVTNQDGVPVQGASVYVNGQAVGPTGSSDAVFPGYKQYNHPEFNPPEEFVVEVFYNGIWSDPSPTLYNDVPPFNEHYSWELCYRYRSNGSAPVAFKGLPLERAFDHAQVALNTASGCVDPNGAYRSDRFVIIDQAGNVSYGQSFIANGNRVTMAKANMTTEFMSTVQWRATIHQGGPYGTQVGGAYTTPSYLSVEYPKVCAFWPLEGANAVQVTPGQQYTFLCTKVAGGTPMTFSCFHNANNSYPNGAMFRDGFELGVDLLGVVVCATYGDVPVGPDADGDGIPDALESDNPGAGQTHRLLRDSDGDCLDDGAEDANQSGGRDAGETDARNRDSDGDGVPDGIELLLGSDPLDAGSPASFADADGDRLPDHLDPNDASMDSDGDRFADGYEGACLGAAAAGNAGVHPPYGDANVDGSVSNVDALVTQSLFLGVINETHVVFGGSGFVNTDTNRDGYISNIDALITQSFFISNLALFPFPLP